MGKAQLVVIPMPGMGHIIPAVEIANRLVERDERISITLIVMKIPFFVVDSYIESLQSDPSKNKRVNFILLPQLDMPVEDNSRAFAQKMIGAYGPAVKQAVEEQVIGAGAGPLAGFVVDLFCTRMIDVANELNVPSYVFFTSGAGFLSIVLHFQKLHDEQGVEIGEELQHRNRELEIPGFKSPVPTNVLPAIFLEKESCTGILNHARRYRETKGILVNSFLEVEPHGIQTLSDDASVPPIYPVGPIVNLNPQNEGPNGSRDRHDSIMRWLDDQPPSSVAFLCFGSMGSFTEEQVKEVAVGLERSGHRFLWSLRRPPPPGDKVTAPRDYDNEKDILPEGFLERTAHVGKIIGWAPQVAVLSHPAIGGFVSHCGWNSTLESLWFGVPIAGWPMYAEQQLNAFYLIKEMGLAFEIRMDFRWDPRKKAGNFVVEAEAVERGVRNVMEMGTGVRRKVKEMSEICRKTTMEGGSSYLALGRFIENVLENIPA